MTTTTRGLASVLLLLVSTGFGADVRADFPVKPFLQNATPESVWIVWESLGDGLSRVDYGQSSDTLDLSAMGTWVDGANGSHIHHVQLTGLTPGVRYYYQATTDVNQAQVAWFTTALPIGTESAFRFVAYSDSQVGNTDTMHEEVVNDGILDYFGQPGGGNIDQVVSFTLVPGDLVGTGSNHGHWQTHFFNQAENLNAHVPLFPALGNHEANADLYYAYMNLPLNGTAGYEEHWYWFDHHNLRVITLDSNPPFDNAQQLAWLDLVLADAAAAEHLDFVLLQFHHPHKSEAWTPGESNFSSEAVARAEQFTEQSGKPSVHFFGHTHAYSRGQSRDHQHLMVNVASAMGSLDYWYHYPNADYDEFQITEIEWGFCVMDVVGGDNPSLTLTRVSRGNDYISRDNEIRDQITIRYQNTPPQKPTPLTPGPGDDLPASWDLNFIADAFVDDDGDQPLESHWQISDSPLNFSQPLASDWKRRENWYRPPSGEGHYSTNTVLDPDIAHTGFQGSLPGCQTLYWRVRYRDDGLQWSDWSDAVAFETGESFHGDAAPEPSDGDTAVSREPTMSWGSCAGATSWKVYLGQDQSLDDTDLIGTVSSPTITAGPLAPSVTYYWRVDPTVDGQTLVGPVWSFTTTRAYPTDWTAEYRFIDLQATDNQDMIAARGTSQLVPTGMIAGIDWTLGDTGGAIPDINGEPARFIKINGANGANRGLRLWYDAPGNGGDVNQFTWVLDLYIEPGQTGRVALWQGNDTNSNQSELQLDCDTGGFWLNGGTGLIGEDLWPKGAWFRLAHRVDYSAGTSALFVDGVEVLGDDVLGAPDWLWGGGSGYSIWLLCDDDTEAGLVRCSSFALADGLMSSHDIERLGGAQAGGVFLDFPSEWRFDDLDPADDQAFDIAFGPGTLTPTGMTRGIDWATSQTGVAVPDINGEQASYLTMDNVWGDARGLRLETHMAGNAGLGCCDLGHMTFVWDLYFNGDQDELQALWQGNDHNANDAELFVVCSTGGFYVHGAGYVGQDLWSLDEWFRVVHRVNYTDDVSALFINGEKVLDNLPAADWVYGEGSDNPIWLLSDDGGWTDVSLVQCAAMAFLDRLLADSEVAALGGPDAAGIFSDPPLNPCPADINNDQVVDVNDLLDLIAQWGNCVGCPADIDHDGVVGVDDLLQLLQEWGDCL